MGKLRNNKGYDAGGLTCELLRYGVRGVGLPVAAVPQGVATVPDVPAEGVVSPSLVECLLQLFEQLPTSGCYPEPMAVSRLVPLHKKQGDASVRDSYRGISISGVVGQLHDSILTARAEQYVDDQQLRAPVQCGFRRKYGTLDALFTMQHLISRHRFRRRLLYVCYVDFQKAFDMVRRDEVIARARQLGMHGKFIDALSQWLGDSKLSVHVNGRHGPAFSTHRGTKQGGRLSPLLFGLFIEQLHELITMKLPGAGPMLEDICVPDIMFADDVKLVATSPEELQSLLDVLHLFCLLFDMPIHIRPQKTCIVVYGTASLRAAVQYVWKLGDQVVPVCDSYTDLGLKCTESAGMRAAHVPLAQGGRKAMHALLTLCKQHHLVQPDLKLRLFNTMVDPALSYGCQVWGPWLFHQKWRRPSPAAPAEAVLVDFLRIMAGVGKRVKSELLLHDFLRLPTLWRWVCLAVRLCTKLTGPAAHDKLSAKALREDVRLMLQGCKDCWVFKLLDTLSDMGVVQREAWQPHDHQWPTVSSVLSIIPTEKHVKEELQARWDDILLDAQPDEDAADAVTHSASADTIMLASYLAWVRPWDLSHKLPHLKCQWVTHKQFQCIARMRLGWHSLAIQQGRFRQVPRCRRSCELCKVHGFVDMRVASWGPAAQGGDGGHAEGDGQALAPPIDPPEDLLHFLVECRILEPVRNQERFRPLFQPDMLSCSHASTLARYIMNYPNQALLADGLLALHERRALCMEQLRQGQFMTDLDEPVCPVLRRQVAFESWYEAPIEVKLAHQWY
jgi:Reverse transcriptase (RNA-dependent DNA polymerase)